MNDLKEITGESLCFYCSGAADVGELSDRITRELSKQGYGKMYCLAGISSENQEMINRAMKARKLNVIDGCELECAKQTLEAQKIFRMNHYVLTSMGFKKGKTEISETNINLGVEICRTA